MLRVLVKKNPASPINNSIQQSIASHIKIVNLNFRECFDNGRVFLEVAHNVASPVIVKTNSVDIKVLGTSFNVNAYVDERAIKTTLL